MTRLSGVDIDPRELKLHESAGRDGDVIETSPDQWAYALQHSVNRVLSQSPQDGIATVTAEVQVEAGRVGVGLVNLDGTAFVAERFVNTGRARVIIRGRADTIGHIVFRNASAAGPSRFRVLRIALTESAAHAYPVNVPPREVRAESIPAGGGSIVFNDEAASHINRARMDFIRSLELPLAGTRVLDIGAGVGHFAQFYSTQGAEVVAVEGRETNVNEMRERYPGVKGVVGDVQDTDLTTFGSFDLVHCFGLLYHLDSPVAALRRMEAVCSRWLLLETMVVDAAAPIMMLADETFAVNQALAGLGCRPSPSFVVQACNRVGFAYVYAAARPPDHPDFKVEWRDNLETSRDGHNLRCVFVASRVEIDHPLLVPLLTTDAGGQ